jgi:SAM-dependent methyltransferase
MKLGNLALPGIDRLIGRRRIQQEVPMPPESLRHRVHGAPDVESFVRVGENCSRDIHAALGRIGRPLESFKHVLDWGCGCGRTLRWFTEYARSVRFYGTDIDAEAIAWCRDNIGYGTFQVNDALPPLSCPNGRFDLVYGISVLSHLDENFQLQWLGELRRVIRPGGIALLSVHGEGNMVGLPEHVVQDIETRGFLYVSTGTANGAFPEWYQTAFHTPKYVAETFGNYFEVLEHLPRGMNNHQDLVILRRS